MAFAACSSPAAAPAPAPTIPPLAEFQWPESEIASLLPVPESNIGNIVWEASYGFVIYVGETSKEQYDAYVDKCKEKGFTVDYSAGDDFYYADNATGYHLNLKYEGNNTMWVRIDEPEKEETTNEESAELTGQPTVTPPVQPTVTPSGQPTEQPTVTPSGESNQEILTVENNEDLAALLALKDPTDSFVSEFAEKYAGKTIEFDGCTAYVSPHDGYATRFDYLIYAGDFSTETAVGPQFQFEDVNYYDLHLTGANIPDTFGVGLNIHIVAEVGEYNNVSGLFSLKPISITIR